MTNRRFDSSRIIRRLVRRKSFVHVQCINDVSFHPNSRVLATCSDDCTVKLFDLQRVGIKRAFRFLQVIGWGGGWLGVGLPSSSIYIIPSFGGLSFGSHVAPSRPLVRCQIFEVLYGIHIQRRSTASRRSALRALFACWKYVRNCRGRWSC